MKRLTSTLVLVLAAGGVVAGTLAATPAARAKDAPLTLEDWDKNYDKLLRDAAKDIHKLSDWCEKNGLEWTATTVVRKVFAYLPDDEDTRKYLGYERQGEQWVQNDIRRDDLRTNYVDDEDPNGKKYRTALAKLTEAIAKDFYGAAVKADKEAVNPDSPSPPAEWKQRAEKAWKKVLDLRPEKSEEKGLYKYTIKYQDAGHQSLGHPKFQGEYVTPFALRHLEVRAERERIGKEYAGKMAGDEGNYKAEVIPAGGALVQAGFTGFGAKCQFVSIYSTQSQEVATRMAKAAQAAVEDAIEIYQFPDELKERLQLKVIDNFKHAENGRPDEFYKMLAAIGRDPAPYAKNDLGGTNISATEYAGTTGDGKGAEDQTINVTNMNCANTAAGIAGATIGRRLNSPEDWLWQSMGYDATQRINDTTVTIWASFGKYGKNVVRRPGQNVWMQLARQQVELDDDVTITQLFPKSLGAQEFRGREIVKGYAFLQFLMESDPAKGREFIWNALPLGTPAAAMKVYGPEILGEANVPEIPAELPNENKRGMLPPAFQTVMDELENRYRTWIIETY